jgi:hypothetical protein
VTAPVSGWLGERPVSLNGRIKIMYRVIVIVSGALAVAACSETPDWTKTPDWMSLDVLKPASVRDTVRFESEPAGAEAKVSNGQTCRTPCALALPVNVPLTVTFTLNGYQPETENIGPISMTGSPTQLQPNPVVVELTPAPPASPKLFKKPERKRKSSATSAAKPAAKPAAKRARPKPAAATTPALAPITAAPAQQQAPAPPEPSAPPPQR